MDYAKWWFSVFPFCGTFSASWRLPLPWSKWEPAGLRGRHLWSCRRFSQLECTLPTTLPASRRRKRILFSPLLLRQFLASRDTPRFLKTQALRRSKIHVNAKNTWVPLLNRLHYEKQLWLFCLFTSLLASLSSCSWRSQCPGLSISTSEEEEETHGRDSDPLPISPPNRRLARRRVGFRDQFLKWKFEDIFTNYAMAANIEVFLWCFHITIKQVKS